MPTTPAPQSHTPRVAVRVEGEHVMTVAAMPVHQQQPSLEEVAAMHAAIRQAEAQAVADATAKHDQPS